MATHITTPTQLQNMASNLSESYILDNDLDMTGFSWTRIGGIGSPFSGNFDGQGFTIRNLTIDDSAGADGFAGMFGVVSSNSGGDADSRPVIKNVNIDGFIITARENVGCVVGDCEGSLKLENIHITNAVINSVVDGVGIGALVGWMNSFANLPSSITNCDVTNVQILSPSGGNEAALVGGLIGFITGEVGNGNVVSNCFASGVIIDLNDLTDIPNDFGGFLGGSTINGGITIQDCYAVDVNISLNGNEPSIDLLNVGGFLGEFYGTIDNCYATGSITITIDQSFSDSVGGFAGYIEGQISNLYADVVIEIAMSNNISSTIDDVGGLCGLFATFFFAETSLMTGCYAQVDITITGGKSDPLYIGGLVGYIYVSTINKCYASGTMTLGDITNNDYIIDAGGLMGYVQLDVDQSIHDCYARVSITVKARLSVQRVGGLIGRIDRDVVNSIKNCYATGDIDAENGAFGGSISIGGLFGECINSGTPNDLDIVNCYSVGTVTDHGPISASTIGGFAGSVDDTTNLNIENCAWWTGAADFAIGEYDYLNTDVLNKNLEELGYGTDEPDNTAFYSKEHAVYAQGT